MGSLIALVFRFLAADVYMGDSLATVRLGCFLARDPNKWMECSFMKKSRISKSKETAVNGLTCTGALRGDEQWSSLSHVLAWSKQRAGRSILGCVSLRWDWEDHDSLILNSFNVPSKLSFQGLCVCPALESFRSSSVISPSEKPSLATNLKWHPSPGNHSTRILLSQSA